MEYQKPLPERTQPRRGWPILAWLLGAGLVLAASLVVLLVAVSPASRVVNNFLVWAFAVDRVQVMWYITRAAGLLAYVLLWLSTAWGLAVSSKIFDPLLHRAFTYDFHQFISLLGIGFLFLHLGVLLFDRYLPYSIAQVLVPFLSPYRPLWVGVGGIAFYLTLLVTVTFYLRHRIGMPAFRAIHAFSLVAFLGSGVHGYFAGTDSPLAATQLLYASTLLVVVFLTTYWLLTRRPAAAPARV